jgi:cephalosporin hydroxylase
MADSFVREVETRIEANSRDRDLCDAARHFMKVSIAPKYSYNFSWLGRPAIQYPQDIVAMQELMWSIQPDLIVETGIAHGGSLIFSASMLELNAACGGPKDAEVLGLDIDIRAHNRAAIESHPMSRRITMLQGSSIAPEIVIQVKAKAQGKQKVLVCLDSSHSQDHVLGELEAYGPLVSVGSYCVVFDTVIEDIPAGMFLDRPWGPGNNPRTAITEYLRTHPEFEVDRRIDHKLLISVAPGGYLKRVS